MSSMPMNYTTFPGGAEDPLALLPRTPVREYRKGEVIYQPQDRGETLYLVIDGRVKINRWPDSASEVILAFLHKDEFFGEVGFLEGEPYGEQAVALEKTTLMQWPIPDLKRLMTRTPMLGAALLRVLAQKLDYGRDRIESFCLDPIHRRLVRTLLHLAKQSGRQQTDDQFLQLPPTTHEQLARYVGTSREIITQSMNEFRRRRLLKYSRRNMELDVPALEKYLEQG